MKLGQIEVLEASCNIQTVEDGRGAIFTWLPDEAIVEFNMIYFQPNKVRGNHYHPEFKEYFLVVTGTVVMVTKDMRGRKELNMHAGPGTCFATPPGVPHVILAVTQAVCIACLTKQWDKCDKPIVHEQVTSYKFTSLGDYR